LHIHLENDIRAYLIFSIICLSPKLLR